jgi:predicted nucleic acid-binding protein
MPLSAVVDASILVSAFLFPESVPGHVLKRAAEARFQMHLLPILVEETRRSLLKARLRNAYRHEESAVQKWCSVAAGAIITGDRDLLALGQFQGVRILTARAFLAES